MMDQLHEWDAPAIAAIKAAIDPRAEFSADDMAEIGRLLTACCMAAEAALRGEGYEREIKTILESLTNGYGCWLEYVEDAIDRAAIPGDDREAAFGMAAAWLLDLHNRRNPFPAGTQQPHLG